MQKVEFTIKSQQSPFFHRLIVAVILTLYVGLWFYFLNRNQDKLNTVFLLLVLGAVLLQNFVIPILLDRLVYIDFTNKSIKYVTEIGRFRFPRKWKTLESVDYISVFKTSNGYEVNLWFNKIKKLNLFVSGSYDTVLKRALFFADKFNIDLLDARERGYHKWINKDILRKNGKIEHF